VALDPLHREGNFENESGDDDTSDVRNGSSQNHDTQDLVETDMDLPTSAKEDRTREFSIPAKIGIFLLSFSVFIVIWEILASISNNSLLLSKPGAVLQALINLLENKIPLAAQGIELPESAIFQTLAVILLGFGLSLAVGIPVGIIAGRWKLAEDIIDPWVSATYSIPIVALIPVLYYAIGGNFLADVFVAFLLSVFTIIVNTQSSIKYTSSTLAEVGKSFRASEVQFITKVVLPASLPDIIAGMRIGLGRAILGAVLAQALLSENGLGGMMMTFQALYATPYMMAVVVLIALMGILVLQGPKLLEKKLFKWKETERMSRSIT
jgi:NitT/TauT family transport system permease protein